MDNLPDPINVSVPSRQDPRPFSTPVPKPMEVYEPSALADMPPAPPSPAQSAKIKKAREALKDPSKQRLKRFGMDTKGKYRYDDINNLPPLEIDEQGYAIRPKPVTPRGRRSFSIEDRKVRFLLMWNYSAGNKTLACQEAGITRKIADEWMADAAFKKLLDDAQEEIADRLHFRIAQRIGLVPIAENIKVNDTALMRVYNKYRPGLFSEAPDTPDRPSADPAIPRPPK